MRLVRWLHQATGCWNLRRVILNYKSSFPYRNYFYLIILFSLFFVVPFPITEVHPITDVTLIFEYSPSIVRHGSQAKKSTPLSRMQLKQKQLLMTESIYVLCLTNIVVSITKYHISCQTYWDMMPCLHQTKKVRRPTRTLKNYKPLKKFQLICLRVLISQLKGNPRGQLLNRHFL